MCVCSYVAGNYDVMNNIMVMTPLLPMLLVVKSEIVI